MTTFQTTAAQFKKAYDVDRSVNPTVLWHATVDRLVAGYYLDHEKAREWKQVPAADVIGSLLPA